MKSDPSNDGITRISYLGIPMEFTQAEVDQRWQEFKAAPLDDQIAEVCGDFHWFLHGLSLNTPSALFLRFWETFQLAKHAHHRAVAVDGLKVANHQDAIEIVEEAHELAALRLENSPYATNCGTTFSATVAAAIARGDIKLVRRILNVMEAQQCPLPASDRRGGNGSEDGAMLEALTRLHAETRALPSKAQLRRACGLNADPILKKTADDRMKKLGLQGLPREAEI